MGGATLTIATIKDDGTYTDRVFSCIVPSDGYVEAVVPRLNQKYNISIINNSSTILYNTSLTSGQYFGYQELDVPIPDTTLENNDWSTISYISSIGKASKYWSVGSTKSITLNGNVQNTTLTNVKCKAVILGINHNSTLEGNNLIHFMLLTDKNYPMAIAGNFQMQTTASNNGGWVGASNMKNVILGNDKSDNTAYTLLSTAIGDSKYLKQCNKYTINDNITKPTVSSDIISLLSPYEIAGISFTDAKLENDYQEQYKFFVNSPNWDFFTSSNEKTSCWTRSPNTNNTSAYFLRWSSNSSFTNWSANSNLSVSPIFFI